MRARGALGVIPGREGGWARQVGPVWAAKARAGAGTRSAAARCRRRKAERERPAGGGRTAYLNVER